MDVRINPQHTPLETPSGSATTSTSCQKVAIKRSGSCGPFSVTCKPPEEVRKPARLCTIHSDPDSESIVAILPQQSIRHAVSKTYSAHRLTASQLPELAATLKQPPPLRITPEPQLSISAQQRRYLSCYLQVPLEISDPEEFSRYMANWSRLDGKWVVKHTKTAVLQSELSTAMINNHFLKVDDIPEAVLTPEFALTCLKECHRWCYESLPARLKTPEFNQQCLEASVLPECLMTETALPCQEIDYAALVSMNSDNIKYVPFEQQSFELCLSVITRNASAIRYINPSVHRYHDLCIHSVTKDSDALELIPKDRITPEILTAKAVHKPVTLADIPEHLITCDHCIQVLKNSELHGQVCDIPASIFQRYPRLAESILQQLSPENDPEMLPKLPDELKTEDFCRRYLSKWPGLITGCPLPLLRKYPEWVERSLKYAGSNLLTLPESERTFDLCRQALIVQNRCMKAVPFTMFEKHQSLLLLAASYSDDLSELPPHLITADICIESLSVRHRSHANHTLSLVSDAVRKAIPYDLLLTVAPSFLPLDMRKEMVATGDTTLPPQYRQKKPVMDQRYLMTPHNPGSQFRTTSGQFLKKILLSTAPFSLRNQTLGFTLWKAIQFHARWRGDQLRTRQLPLAQPICAGSTVYGGRTLMVRGKDTVTRMKFLRKNESTDVFFQEEAVHLFTHNRQDLKSLLKSEVPKPVGLKLVPAEHLPDNILSSFRSELDTFLYYGKKHYLVYEFTTRNEEYSTLAHQKDSDGDSTRAEQGLLKACHDLGVWSSLGAVHTSTIQAYHNFMRNRRELILIFMFTSNNPFPGAMTGWDSKATDESDWAYSGLKDIGDMEFYPKITAYSDATDADCAITAGVGQRASFMSAAVENMMAPILHYARMHRDDPDYHYRNSEGREKLGAFIDEVIGAYSSGLLGRSVNAGECFESSRVHQLWKHNTTAETALWTARQHLNADCFARNLEQTGNYCKEIYPDLQYLPERYPEDFTSYGGQDNLGPNHGHFALTLLLRGLYQVAAFLASTL